MATTETLGSVTRDPTDFIDQEMLQQIIATLQDEFATAGGGSSDSLTGGLTQSDRRGGDTIVETAQVKEHGADAPGVQIHIAAASHRFVYSRAEYGDELTSGLNHPPRETITESGNCADQSLLLYALYREAGIPARITSATKIDGNENHSFVECGFASDPDEVIEVLGAFYREAGIMSSGRYHYFEEDGQTYFLADPVASRFIGDKSGLKEMGYVGRDEGLEINRRFTLYGDSLSDR